MTGLEFMARLAAIICPPRYPLTRFAGVLAPRSKWRREIVPKPREKPDRCDAARDEKSVAAIARPERDRAESNGDAPQRPANHQREDGERTNEHSLSASHPDFFATRPHAASSCAASAGVSLPLPPKEAMRASRPSS
jgi:hypothetical protein